MTNVKKDILWRVVLSMILMVLFAAVIFFFTARIQVVEGQKWRELSDSMTLRYKEIPAIRGNIYSEDGNLLATSIPKYKVSVDMTVIPSDSFYRFVDEVAVRLSQTFGNKSADEYNRMLRKGKSKRNRYLTLTRNASYIQLRDMKSWPIFRMGRYQGGLIEEERTERKLPLGQLASRTIGFKNENISGVGLEATYDALLSGISGTRLFQKISGGYKPISDENEIEPQNGSDIYTSLDVNIQDITHSSLLKSLMTHNAHHGTAVVMEVKTGKIKAIANLTRNTDGSYSERFNYALGGNFEPGSTFKLLAALALLEDGYNLPDDSIEINYGQFRFFDRIMKDSEISPFDKITFRQSIEKSSNVGVSRLVYNAYKSQPSKFIGHIKRLHLNEPCKTGIKGEALPKLREPGQAGWSGTALPWISIGYALEMTPLHILMFYNAIANGGKMMKPMLITGTGQLGKITEKYEPVALEEKICNEKTLKVLQEMLRGVVEQGTATNLKDAGVSIAGKTGTAQIAMGAEGYNHDRYNASFAGYFPAENPMYSCIVVVSEPSNGAYYGSVVAGPVFKDIARKVYAKGTGNLLVRGDSIHLPGSLNGHSEDILTVLKELEIPYVNAGRNKKPEWMEGKAAITQMLLGESDYPEEVVPNFIGMGLRDALYLAENRKLRVVYGGYGKIVSQIPSAGSRIQKGEKVQLKMEFH